MELISDPVEVLGVFLGIKRGLLGMGLRSICVQISSVSHRLGGLLGWDDVGFTSDDISASDKVMRSSSDQLGF